MIIIPGVSCKHHLLHFFKAPPAAVSAQAAAPAAKHHLIAARANQTDLNNAQLTDSSLAPKPSPSADVFPPYGTNQSFASRSPLPHRRHLLAHRHRKPGGRMMYLFISRHALFDSSPNQRGNLGYRLGEETGLETCGGGDRLVLLRP